MTSVLKNIFVIAGFLLICGLGYYLYTQNNGSLLSHDGDASVTSSIQASQEAEILLRQLNDIKSIQINNELFSDPRFTTLVNNTTEVEPSSIGRSTPFEPAITN